ncbi:ly6/PLAUR domain-containing protein 6-like [Littorina saxatilis]|uniref:Uncharacterized protein n=1 Tax=Littorina saxatilis TaxID=31220 RepID=A0AAN9GNJ2_9CAEN
MMQSGARTASVVCGTKRGAASHVQKYCVFLLCSLLTLSEMCSGTNSYVWAPTSLQTSDITCWTCDDKANNEDCNNWAPDLKCPINHTVCQTVHRFTVAGRSSVHVTKRCVQATECTPQHVGCSQADPTGQQECTSCCDYSYCNQEVPVNRSTALQLSSFTATSASHACVLRPPALLLVLCVLTAVLRVSLSCRLSSYLLAS